MNRWKLHRDLTTELTCMVRDDSGEFVHVIEALERINEMQLEIAALRAENDRLRESALQVDA